MVTYLADGGFLDSQTERVDVEFATICPASNQVSLVNFSFNWQVGPALLSACPSPSPTLFRHTTSQPLCLCPFCKLMQT